MKSIGTVTTRLASENPDDTKKFNLLNQVKTRGYLECFVPPEGFTWLHLDFSSVEPHVCAEFSRDDNYMKLYGRGSVGHDVYIFVGLHLSMFRDKFSKYYDIDFPTKDAISKVKEYYKKDRSACKEFHLSGMYGAGWRTQYKNLILKEYDTTEGEIEQANREYWSDLFPGVKDYSDRLTYQWNRQGWISDAFGMPMAIHWTKKRDCLSRFCQRSAHILLQKYLVYFNNCREEYNLPVYPAIPDYHDGTFWFVKTGSEEDAMGIMRECIKELNEEIQWEVQIKGEPEIGSNLADLICED